MRLQLDPLYSIFEQYLFNALVEDESTDEFIVRVVSTYLTQLSQTSVIPQLLRASIEEDLRDEVLEMLRKKTYGHHSLREFSKAASTALVPVATAATAAAEKAQISAPPAARSASSRPARRRRPS